MCQGDGCAQSRPFAGLWFRSAFACLQTVTVHWKVRSVQALQTLSAPAGRVTVSNPLKPSGHYMYHQFNIQQFYVQPTLFIYVFCVDLRANSDYFPIQH